MTKQAQAKAATGAALTKAETKNMTPAELKAALYNQHAARRDNTPRPVGKRTHTMPSKLEANAKATKAAEASAKAANTTKLAKVKANAKPVEPAPKQKGSGAAVGVAQGAMDGQPHTKLAVEQARRAANANPAKLPPAARKEYDKLVAIQAATKAKRDELVVAGKKVEANRLALILDQTNAAMRAILAKDYSAEKTVPKAKPVPKAARQPKAVAGPRAYKLGATPNEAKVGTWRHHMLTTIMAHKATDAASAAHAKGKAFTGQKLDFNWAAKQGYITFQ